MIIWNFIKKIFCFDKIRNDIQPIENNVFSDENLTKIPGLETLEKATFSEASDGVYRERALQLLKKKQSGWKYDGIHVHRAAVCENNIIRESYFARERLPRTGKRNMPQENVNRMTTGMWLQSGITMKRAADGISAAGSSRRAICRCIGGTGWIKADEQESAAHVRNGFPCPSWSRDKALKRMPKDEAPTIVGACQLWEGLCIPQWVMYNNKYRQPYSLLNNQRGSTANDA